MVVLLIGVIFGFASLAVDASQLYKVRTEGQNAADATALAAATEIDGTSTGITEARALAVAYAPNNDLYGQGAVADGTNVTFGRWSASTGVFTSLPDSSAVEINAVRVQLTPANVHNPFAVLQGRAQTNVGAYAIAAAGGSASDCTSPLVAGDCSSGIGSDDEDRCLLMQNAVTDTAGWTDLDEPGGMNGNLFAGLLRNGCINLMPGCAQYDATATACDGTCYSTTVDQTIGTNNGNFFSESSPRYGSSCGTAGGTGRQDLGNPCEVIKQLLLRQTNPDASELAGDLVSVTLSGSSVTMLRGTYFELQVPLIPGTISSGVCSADFNNGSPGQRITGYATLDIYGVKCGNPDTGVVDDGYLTDNATELAALACDPPSDKFILGRMRIVDESGIGGGGNPGNSSARPRLVE